MYLNNVMLQVKMLLKYCFELNFKDILKKLIRVPGPKCAKSYLNNIMIHVEVLIKTFLIKF